MGSFNPSIVTTLNTGSEQRYLRTVGNYVYMTRQAGVFYVIDVSTPRVPVVVGTLDDAAHLGGVTDLEVSGSYSYVATSAGLAVVDISTPASPSYVTKTTFGSGAVGGTSLVGNTVCCFEGGSPNGTLYTLDISTPASPTLVGSVAHSSIAGPYRVKAAGTKAYISGNQGIAVFDISTPASPAYSGSASDGGASLRGLDVSYPYAYTTNNGGGFGVWDISNPASITKTGFLNDSNLTLGLGCYYQSPYVFTVHQTETYNFNAFRVSTPASPTLVASLSSSTALGHAFSVVAPSRYAYIAVPENGFTVIDLFPDDNGPGLFRRRRLSPS